MRGATGLAVALVLGLGVAVLAMLGRIGGPVAGLLLGSVLLVLAVAWVMLRRDLRVIAYRLRRALAAAPPTVADAADPILLGRLGQDADRIAREMMVLSRLVERQRRADTAILARLPDPLVVLSGDVKMLRANDAARREFGESLPAVLRHPEVRAAAEKAMETGQDQSVPVSLPVPVAREVVATVVPMDAPLGDGGLAVLVLSDRTRERAVERMRADFVANVSHELRTPLASLIGFTETLLGPAADDPPAQKRFLGIMAEQGRRMHRLIDDLLSLSRIEVSEHQAPSDPVDLAALLGRLAAGFETRLAERNARLETALAAGLPPVAGDGDQLAQVVQNLLENALKYGRDGGTIRLSLRRADETGAIWPARPGLVVSVADDGIGIPREHLPRLTERFYRVDKGRSRAVGGTGLGLAIVKHIVNRHRGQLRIESEEGVGTTMSVWLPLAG